MRETGILSDGADRDASVVCTALIVVRASCCPCDEGFDSELGEVGVHGNEPLAQWVYAKAEGLQRLRA